MISKFSINKKGITKTTSSFLPWFKIQSNSAWGKKKKKCESGLGDFSKVFILSVKAESCLNTKEKFGSVQFVPGFS